MCEDKVIYQIYPLGFCGCNIKDINNLTKPVSSDSKNNIKKIIEWIPYLKSLGIGTLYLNPIFQSDKHGYDTRDYTKIDYRLGTNKDFKKVCKALHEAGIKVIIDAVFNHVGRGFWAFQDVIENQEKSKYKDWFYLDWNCDSKYHDNFYYGTWNSHYELVKLNLKNEELKEYLFNVVDGWKKEFGIDGLRLDVAYCLDKEFLDELKERNKDLFIFGEVISDNFKDQYGSLDSSTDYLFYGEACARSGSLLSYFNANNDRYNKKQLITFLDNHDVSRITSIVNDENRLKILYLLLFTMRGIPCIYYGSEWGIRGEKKDFDLELRPELNSPITNELSEYIKKLIHIRNNNKSLQDSKMEIIYYKNERLIFRRGDIVVMINYNDYGYEFYERDNGFDLSCIFGKYEDLLNGGEFNVEDKFSLGSYEMRILKLIV